MENIAMRFTLFSLLLLAVFVAPQTGLADEAKTVVGYVSTENQEAFEKTIKPLFEEFKGKCKNCEIVNKTPYDDKGNYSEKDLVEKLKAPDADVSFYLFSWNKKAGEPYKDLVALLEEKVASGKLVIAPTGKAANGEAGLPLSRSVMGQAKDVIIIGEALERERLLPQSYFGPEMLSAIRPPKEYIGQGYSPLYFGARLAAVWNKRKPAEWLEHFKTKKLKSRKIWLDADDLLGR
ncbi:hypothetical protein [Bdellovibrio sp. HCB337]|uniref:hypothetical protein n=1 Tax=Bdellovibrio sp. HCB337 TaxID=3394358 RepID=UPI0039A54E9E